MASQTSCFRSTVAVVLPLVAGLILSTAFSLPSRAAESYTIPASDGYGIGECMESGNDCGRVMADSWCEAHGHAHVLAYGTNEDVTGAIKASTTSGPAPASAAGAAGEIVIRCGD